ncbi:MAG: hypothetical protein IJW71_06715 [Clostridia bacterium]|nr:hypothetical protein [Clostridia bacterium]
MITEYSRELEALPKGSIKPKKVKDKIYYYLSFRDGDKVITKYIGKDEEALIPLREQLARRKQVEEILKKLKALYRTSPFQMERASLHIQPK